MQFTKPDTVELLCASHRQIERALALLIRAANAPHDGALCDSGACFRALRFFRVTVPEHSAFEEEILFPGVRRVLSSDRLRLLDALEDEHGCAERAHSEVERLMELWNVDRRLPSTDKSRLAVILDGLAELYRRHMEVEEREVFPLVAQLSPEDRDQLGAVWVRR